MHARLVIVICLSLLTCGHVLAGPITPNEVRPPRGVRPMPDLVPQRPITANLTDLSWQRPRGAADLDLASSVGIDCLGPGPAVPGLSESPAGSETAEGQTSIRTWGQDHTATSLAAPLIMPGDGTSSVEASRSAGVTDVTP